MTGQKLFEVQFTPELEAEVQRILTEYRQESRLDTSSEAAVVRAIAFELHIRQEAIGRLWRALERAQAPAIDSGVIEALNQLKAIAVK